MKITHVSFSNSGGAGVVMNNLVAGQIALGLDVTSEFVIEESLRSRPIKYPGLTLAAGLDEFLFKSPDCPTTISILRNKFETLNLQKISQSSLLHLHWMNGVGSLRRIANFAPSSTKFVWTLHDMNPFTGGCHHSHKCDGFRNSCMDCPQVRVGKKLIQVEHKKKKLSAKELVERIIYVAPSGWMKQRAQMSSIIGKSEIVQIANPVSDIFFTTPFSRDIRRKFDIPEDEVCIVVSCSDLADKNKNIGHLVKIFRKLQLEEDEKLRFLFIGDNHNSLDLSGLNAMTFGRLSQSESRDIFSISYLHVSASQAESFSLVTAEAAAQGTPTICLRESAASEIAMIGAPGYLVDEFEGLFEAIKTAIKDKNVRLAASSNLKKYAFENFQPQVVSEQYKRLYEKLHNAQK